MRRAAFLCLVACLGCSRPDPSTSRLTMGQAVMTYGDKETNIYAEMDDDASVSVPVGIRATVVSDESPDPDYSKAEHAPQRQVVVKFEQGALKDKSAKVSRYWLRPLK